MWMIASAHVVQPAACLWNKNKRLRFGFLQIGTYQMALCSKAHNKPFYVVAESFKFVRLYPLNQQDVPDKFKVWPRTYFFTLIWLFYLMDFFTRFFLASTVQSRHPQDHTEPVRAASDDRLHTSLPHHPPLHRSGSPDAISRERRTHQTLFITVPHNSPIKTP